MSKKNDSPVAKPLREKALLVRLEVSAWSGRKVDREVSRDVIARAEASKDSGVFTKRLLPKEALEALQSAGTAARAAHYLFTMPWDDRGTRLLPVALFPRYQATLDDCIAKHAEAKKLFLHQYEQNIEDARSKLGTLFNANEYPSRGELGDRISIDYLVEPIPDSAHFVVDIGAEEAERIKKGLTHTIESRINGTVVSLFQRVAEMVQLCSFRLDEDDDGKPRVFRDSMVENLRELAGMLGDLNLTENDALTSVSAQLSAALTDVQPNNLRVKHKDFDADKHQRVRATVNSMAAAMAGVLRRRQRRGRIVNIQWRTNTFVDGFTGDSAELIGETARFKFVIPTRFYGKDETLFNVHAFSGKVGEFWPSMIDTPDLEMAKAFCEWLDSYVKERAS